MTHADHAAARALAEEIIDRFDRSRNATWPANAEQWAMAERLASIRAEFIARALLSALDREARARALLADARDGVEEAHELLREADEWLSCEDGVEDVEDLRDRIACLLACPPPASAEGGA